jgi:hypothetical protein
MKILQPEEINNPNAGLILEAPLDEDWVLGHPVLGAILERLILQPNRDWTPFITEYELQRNSFFDAYDCVTQSAWNKIQCLAHRQYDEHLDESKRWTAVKSGTVPGQGNSVKNVVECIRKMGGVKEEDWISMSDTMTQSEFYKEIPDYVSTAENFMSAGWEYSHEWLPVNYIGATMGQVVDSGLPYSPVMISIEGQYEFDAEGRLQYHGGPYSHEVLIVASKPDHFLVLDSENPNGLMKVRRDYAFVGPKIGYLKKKSYMLVKEDGSPAVYLQTLSGDLYALADGEGIAGGDMLKTFSGNYGNAAIKHVAAGSLDKSKIVGDIRPRKYGIFNF